MNETAKEVINDLLPIFDATELALNEWQGEGNLQMPVLIELIAKKLNWDDKQARRSDPFVREYIRKSKEWHITRGAYGGIMRAQDKQKKEDAKSAKSSIRKQMEAAIEAKEREMRVAAQPSDMSAAAE